MRRYIALGVLVVWLVAAAAFGRVATTQPSPGVTKPAAIDGGIAVYFSPQGGATQAIVAEIVQAKDTVQVQAYSFSSADIAKALVDYHSTSRRNERRLGSVWFGSGYGIKAWAFGIAKERLGDWTSQVVNQSAKAAPVRADRHAVQRDQLR